MKYTHIVVIVREGVPSIYGFYDHKSAMAFADAHGAQWSETYGCEIVKGPLV